MSCMRPIVGICSVLGLAFALCFPTAACAQSSFAEVNAATQPKIAKIFGAGGIRGLEAYQSGFFISGEGHILTVWSYVLDSEDIAIYMHDGRKHQATLIGMDPRTEIAILKIEAEGLPHFNLNETVDLATGARVLAFSNLFGVALGNEPASVLHGVVAAKTELAARRGAFESNYHGPAYVLDAMTNNPGVAGGVLTDRRGRLAALLGKELRSSTSNIWLNYAIPIAELRNTIDELIAGKFRPAPRTEADKKPKQFHTLALLGIRLVPDFLPRTPPFVESVLPGSPAAKAGIRADDLVLFVNGRVAPSTKILADELSYIDKLDTVRLTIQRGTSLHEITLQPEL